MALNKALLIGNVGKEPEIRTVQGGAKVAQFTIATTDKWTDRDGNKQEQTEWHNIVVWNKSADFVEKYIHKGDQVFVEGKIRTRQWTDQSGNKRFTTEIEVASIQILGRKPEAQGQAQPAPRPQQRQQEAPSPALQALQSPEPEGDDLPF